MSDAWLVPMTIGLCLDMCGVFLLAKTITFSRFVKDGKAVFDQEIRKELEMYSKKSKANFVKINTILNEKIPLPEEYTLRQAFNEIFRIEASFANYQLYIHDEKLIKIKHNVSNIIIIVFGIGLMILGTALVPFSY